MGPHGYLWYALAVSRVGRFGMVAHKYTRTQLSEARAGEVHPTDSVPDGDVRIAECRATDSQ